MWEMVKKFKELVAMIMLLSAFGSGAWFAMTYFNPRHVFAEHVRQQELQDLRSLVISWQKEYGCFKESCANKMPASMYEEYLKKLDEIRDLESK